MDKRVGLVRTSEVGGYSAKPKLRILRHWESLPQREKRTYRMRRGSALEMGRFGLSFVSIFGCRI